MCVDDAVVLYVDLGQWLDIELRKSEENISDKALYAKVSEKSKPLGIKNIFVYL